MQHASYSSEFKSFPHQSDAFSTFNLLLVLHLSPLISPMWHLLNACSHTISVHMGEDTEGMIALKEKLPEDAVAVAAVSGRGFGGPASLFKV